jgi:hypothetical protein
MLEKITIYENEIYSLFTFPEYVPVDEINTITFTTYDNSNIVMNTLTSNLKVIIHKINTIKNNFDAIFTFT